MLFSNPICDFCPISGQIRKTAANEKNGVTTNMKDKIIPGTVLPYAEIDGSMFSFFLPMLKATDGLSLGQVCSITGLEVSTIQNWVKRGFVAHPVKKKYHERHLARILMISAVRDSMKIEQIGALMKAVNGDTEDTSDDIISEPLLYDYLCEAIREIDSYVSDEEEIRAVIERVTEDYSYPDENARERLMLALLVMVTAYISARLKKESEDFFSRLSSL